MCGIVAYIGNQESTQILLTGLRELEYRGYDSAGIALLEEGKVTSFKAVGKLDNLVNRVGSYRTSGPTAAIGHTRWATHGKPTEANAHPHGLTHSQVVHNGIIENHLELRQRTSGDYLSQTDTEVIVHLFEQFLVDQGDSKKAALNAFRQTIEALEGAFAILLVTENRPGEIFFARQGSPLQVALTDHGCYFASSDAPMVGTANQAIYLEDGDWGVAKSQSLAIFDRNGRPAKLQPKPLATTSTAAKKEGFRYFMEKEIYEQNAVVADILTGRVAGDHVRLDELPEGWLTEFSSITLCACGTSYHAALAGSYLLERLAKVPARVEIASEFRYREPMLDPGALFVVISQSGETADTLEALKLAAAQGLQTLAFCNVDNSSIVRAADQTILLRAGIEKGVASTKAFTAQVMALWLRAVFWGQTKGVLGQPGSKRETRAMQSVREAVAVQPRVHDRLHRLSKRYLHGHGFFYIGRDLFYPLALEGALKLKEISYLHAEGYPAGEMKHGPIALADAELFTIALMPRTCLHEKIKSNVEELSARDSTIIAITTEYFELADDLIQIRPYDHPMLEFFEMMVVVQLLALEISIRLGNDVDMPRNLAKSVTVE